MRALVLGLVIIFAALPLGCGEDDGDRANDDAGQGSAARAGTGGKGSRGTSDFVSEGGGDGGTPASGGSRSAAARLPLCESICTTEHETSCPPPDHDACVKGWCADPDVYYPGCVGEYDAMLDCMVNEPATSYYCDDTGMAFPKEEACEGEQAEFLDCLRATLE